jgi:hypothetical protein
MSQVVYKYGPIPNYTEKYVAWVEGNPVHAEQVNGGIFVWAIVNPDMDADFKIRRRMVYYPTGREFSGVYWFTVVDDDGFVWHVVEKTENLE